MTPMESPMDNPSPPKERAKIKNYGCWKRNDCKQVYQL